MRKLSMSLVISVVFLTDIAAQGLTAPITDWDLSRWKELLRRSDRMREKGEYDSAREILERALDLARNSREDGFYEGSTLSRIGALYIERGEYRQAGPALTRALSLLEHATGRDHFQLAACWYALAVYHRNVGEYVAAESEFGQAISLSQRNPLNEATALFGIGLLYAETARYERSVAALTECLKVLQSQPEPDSVRVSETLTNLAIAYLQQGQVQKGEPLLRRAIRIAGRDSDAGSLAAASAEHTLGALGNLRGEFPSAEKYLRRALAVFERLKGPGHRDVAAVLLDLSETVLLQHRYREAESLAIRARAISEKTLGVEHVMSAQAMCMQAKAISGQGRHADSEVLFRDAVAIFQRRVGPEDPRTASAMADLALLRHMQGDDGEASILYAQVVRIEEKVSPESPHFAGVLIDYARVLRRQKQKQLAETMEKRARLAVDTFRRNSALRTIDISELK